MKTAFITGATSGIGKAAVTTFAAAGWRVVAIGRRAERLADLENSLAADRLRTCAVDVRDDAAIEAAFAALPEPFRQPDCLINSAGLSLGRGPFQQGEMDQWQAMIETNVLALLSMTRRLLPSLIKSKGIVINISSAAASYPYANSNVYGASKAFVTRLSLGLRSDLHGTGVRVTSVEPGMVETEFMFVRSGGDAAEHDRAYRGTGPLAADDIADTLLWIAERPARVNINRIEIFPTSQSLAGFQIAKKG